MNTLNTSNPYEAPVTVSAPPQSEQRRTDNPKVLLLMWAVVFVLNMLTPLFFGSALLGFESLGSMLAAASLLMIGGYCLLLVYRRLARPVIWGALLIGFSQLVPIIHLMAGVVGLETCSLFALALGAERDSFTNSAWGGFLITFITGSILIVISACAGFALQFITSRRWWGAKE